MKDLYQSITFYSLDPRYNIENIYQQNRTGNDYRWDEWFIPASQTSATRLKKITDIYQLNNKPCPAEVIQGINLIRLPEMYYIASEGNGYSHLLCHIFVKAAGFKTVCGSIY